MFRKETAATFITPILLFFLTITIYVLTLSRSVYFGDSGEFIAVAKTLGIAHPPGYPLYTIIAHLFTYLPWGNLPFKVNLFSAVTSSLTVVVVYFICLKLTKNRLASASASLFLAFSYLFWLYSLVAEVFSLNNLFVALIILISLHIFEKPQAKLFYLLSFTFGLSLTNHHTILFLVPALLFLILSTNPKLLLNPKFIILNSFFILLGLLPYLYLPIRASQHPNIDWGNPDTLKKLLDVLFRRDYGTFTLGPLLGKPQFNLSGLLFYLGSQNRQFTAVGIIFAVLGFFHLAKNRRAFYFILLSLLLLGPVFILISRAQVSSDAFKGIFERFLISSSIPFTIFLGFGLSQTIGKLAPNFGRLAPVTAALFIVPLLVNFHKVNQRGNFLYENFGRQIFQILPNNPILLVSSDRGMMISAYLQEVEKIRPDIRVVNFTLLPADWYQENLKHRYPGLNLPWEKFTRKTKTLEAAKIICREVVPKNQIFVDNWLSQFTASNNSDCSYLPFGPLVELAEPGKKLTEEQIKINSDFWASQGATLKQLKPFDFRTADILMSYSVALTYFGVNLEESGKSDDAQKNYLEAWEISSKNSTASGIIARKYLAAKDYENALIWGEKTVSADPQNASASKDLGFLYLDYKKDKKKAYYYFQKYLNLAPEAQDRDQIENLVEKLRSEL